MPLNLNDVTPVGKPIPFPEAVMAGGLFVFADTVYESQADGSAIAATEFGELRLTPNPRNAAVMVQPVAKAPRQPKSDA